MYFSRAVAVAVYLAAPKTSLTFYLFAAVLGSPGCDRAAHRGLIGKLFGVRYLATLFGSHVHPPDRRFFGAWLGGNALRAFGDFSWMWYADIALALARRSSTADPRRRSCGWCTGLTPQSLASADRTSPQARAPHAARKTLPSSAWRGTPR
jgi:hypothetical protein